MTDSKDPPKPGDAGASGSVEVQLSHPAIPEPVPAVDSRPVSSGRVEAVASGDTSERTGRGLIGAAVSGGVEKLGSGIGTLGEGVTKLGDAMPLVGAGVARLGEGITKAGESIQGLPRVAQTRRGRLLVRSMVVGFLLVAAWIAAIVGWQIHGNDSPDFRPAAEHILVEISRGEAAIGDVYEHASPRFQEMVRKERFLDDMTDLNVTVGKFREITAINETLVTTGPTGRIGRVGLTAAYDRGICKGSISFHYDQGQWKLLGIGVELPPNLTITQAQRQERVKACDDPDDRKKCPVRDAAETILERLRDGHAGDVWDAASAIFKKQEARAKFVQIQDEHRTVLGAYKRILRVTEARVIGGTSATFDVVSEFEKSSGVRTVFGFERGGKTAPWQLRSFKLVVPMPRADEEVVPPRVTPSRGR